MLGGRAVQRDNPKYNIETISPVYAYANEERGPAWYDVENYELPRDSPDPYQLIDWIGTGKYSDVFTAKHGSEIVAIKVLKPVRQQKYNREAKILEDLRGGTNIVNLHAIVYSPLTRQYSFVFEHINDVDFNTFMRTTNDKEARFYLYQLMRALQYCHSHGIMHRDVKPLNILYDRQLKKVRLIDWGLAEFYHPRQRYNIHVASRNFKPIELLLDYQCYDYSIDIWSFGVTMASLIFKMNPFFKGNDDIDMISRISSVLGGQKLKEYMLKYGLPEPESGDRQVISRCIRKKPKPWAKFEKPSNRDLISPEAIDLLDRCLRYDHMERITADQALQHPYFDIVRNLESN